jgi:hypothetical protein
MDKNDVQFLIEGIAKDIVLMLMRDYGMTMAEAFDELYRSETFRKLEDPATLLYYQSSIYVYSFLQEELNKGVMK